MNRLPPEEAHHAISVLRIRSGESVILFNGTGMEADGVVANVTRRDVHVDVKSIRSCRFDFQIHLTIAVAMIKSHRQTYMIEKCTELGAFAIQPLITERGVVQADEAGVDKWRRRAIEAAKQSKRAWVPEIHEPISIANALASATEFDWSAVADLGEGLKPLSTLLGESNQTKLIIFIGPEGGWTKQERALFEGSNVQAVTLAPTVLRTETAAIAACAATASRSQELAANAQRNRDGSIDRLAAR